MAEVTRIIHCSVVEFYVTPEVTFENLVEQFVPEAGLPHDPYKQIELPELFARDGRRRRRSRHGPERAAGRRRGRAARILLVSDQAFLGISSCPIFAREGLDLMPAADPADITEAAAGRQVPASPGGAGNGPQVPDLGQNRRQFPRPAL